MVHISKQELSEKVRIKILAQLFQVVTGSRKSGSRTVLGELLSPDEQLQYAKRIAIILLLARDVPHRTIARTLAVSTSTVAAHDQRRCVGEYCAIERLVSTRSSRAAKEVGQLLIDLLDVALTPYTGTGRARTWQKTRRIVERSRSSKRSD